MPLGTGGAILNGLQYCKEQTIAIANGDTYFDVERAVHRKLSMSIFLNEDYDGGEFDICTGNQQNKVNSFKEYPGSAIIFPSFMCHRVRPVTKGIRKSLVVWFTGPNWK
jgi:predicted 2-oxoglutarate/Fe(II)-dependent dioxygenase YbiX